MRTGIVLGVVIGVLLGVGGVALATHVFPDVPDGHPHAAGIEWASEAGLVHGYADGRFGPGDAVTRGQLATMFHRQGAYRGPVYTVTPVCGSTEIELREHNHRGTTAATIEYAIEGGPRVEILTGPVPDDGTPLTFDPGAPGVITFFVDGLAQGIARTAEDC